MNQQNQLHCFFLGAMERAAKLRRLEGLRRENPHISASALSSLVQDIQVNGLPDLHNRKHLKEARDFRIQEMDAYGPLFTQAPVMHKDGKERQLMFVNFFSLFFALFQQGGSFTTLVKKTLEACPCSPAKCWELIFYSDEIVPGQFLQTDSSRKIQAVYLSIKQFGGIALSQEQAWLLGLAKRSAQVNDLEASISQVTAILLDHIFNNSLVDASTTGFVIKDQNGTPFKIYLTLGMLLQDGAAHRQVWSLKGDAGSKFCLFCSNLYTEKSGIIAEDQEEILVANSWSLQQVKQATDEDVLSCARRLAEKKNSLSKSDFELWQQAVGMTWNPYSLLQKQSLQRHLKPTLQFVHDYMHCFLVTGIFQTVMFLTLKGLHDALETDIYNSVATCVNLWKLPAGKAADLASFFSKKRQKANALAKTFKCTASEALALGPVFAYYLLTMMVPLNVCSKQCLCMLALIDLIEMLQLVPLDLITPATLQQACEKFVALCLEAGYKEYMHTKFHWALHFPQHLAKHRLLPSCFVQERKHKMIKRLWVLNGGSYLCMFSYCVCLFSEAVSWCLICLFGVGAYICFGYT